MLKPLNTSVKKSLTEATDRFAAALPGSPAETYLAGRGITAETAARMRLGFVDGVDGTDIPGRLVGRLAIPNLSFDGHAVGMKFRLIADRDEPKYDGLALPARLYNLHALSWAGDYVAVTEGEIDTVTLTQYGIPAIAVPGVQAWKAHHKRILEGFQTVILFRDYDEPGRALHKAMAADLPGLRATDPPGGFKDVNEACQAGHGAGLVDIINRILRQGNEDDD